MTSDHFSTQSKTYARFRPRYPKELFAWISGLAYAHDLAWDCACGNGQATQDMAPYFKRVIGTDLSEAQLSHAPNIANVTWRVAPAENSGIDDRSADLVTVAQALHWFDIGMFWAECRRVLKPDGMVAAWSYGIFELSDRRVADMCDEFYETTVGRYWPPERDIVVAGYQSIDFPFIEITAPPFRLTAHWTLDELLGYLSSWSATERYRTANGTDPIPALRTQLEPLFTKDRIEVRWPLSIRAGRV